jgi:hypothetical protein
MKYSHLVDSEYGMDPVGRSRFFGIYSAKVEDVNDPLKQNRIKVKVFQTTGQEVTGWARACLPITDSSYHPDHAPHTAVQIAAMLTTTPVSVTDSRGDTETVPALTIVPKAPGNQQLNHQHVITKTKTRTQGQSKFVANEPTSTTDSKENSLYTVASGLNAPGITTTDTSIKVPEHTFHRSYPVVGQMIWVMFVAGDPEYPVWIGVQ